MRGVPVSGSSEITPCGPRDLRSELTPGRGETRSRASLRARAAPLLRRSKSRGCVAVWLCTTGFADACGDAEAGPREAVRPRASTAAEPRVTARAVLV